MNLGKDFVEISENFSLLKSKYIRKNVRLPITISREGYSKINLNARCVILVFCASLFVGLKHSIDRRQVAIMVFAELISVMLLIGLLRRAVLRWRVGPGEVVISSSGFSDSRMSDQTVAWSSFKSASIDSNFKSGEVRGVVLALADGVDAPSASVAYRRAFPIFRNDDRCVYVDLDGVKNARDIAHAVQALILRHNPQA